MFPMSVLIAFAAAALASSPVSSRIPDSAIYLVQVSPGDARHYARALVGLAAKVGLPPSAIGSDAMARAIAAMSPAERKSILLSQGLTPAFFNRIGAQVRHSRPLGRIVTEELRIAGRANRG